MKTQHTKAEYTLKPHEVQNIIASCKNLRDRCMIKCMYYGGMRVSEVAKLEVQHIDFSRKQITIFESKFGKTRTIPVIDSIFLSDLQILIHKATSGRIFPLSRRHIQHLTEKAGQIAQITNPDPTAKHINCHLFRHSIARHLKSMNYQIEFIQKFLGHSSLKTTADVYGTLSINEMQQIVASKTGDVGLLGERKQLTELMYNDTL